MSISHLPYRTPNPWTLAYAGKFKWINANFKINKPVVGYYRDSHQYDSHARPKAPINKHRIMKKQFLLLLLSFTVCSFAVPKLRMAFQPD